MAEVTQVRFLPIPHFFAFLLHGFSLFYYYFIADLIHSDYMYKWERRNPEDIVEYGAALFGEQATSKFTAAACGLRSQSKHDIWAPSGYEPSPSRLTPGLQ